jgi:hypothetical protein
MIYNVALPFVRVEEGASALEPTSLSAVGALARVLVSHYPLNGCLLRSRRKAGLFPSNTGSALCARLYSRAALRLLSASPFRRSQQSRILLRI